MGLNYKKELENAAKTMILVHKLDTLIKLIVRVIINKLNVMHAGILLFDKTKQSYVLSFSRGKTGMKIPKGFMRINKDHPLIAFFNNGHGRKVFGDNIINYKILLKALKNKKFSPIKDDLIEIKLLMEDLEIVACVPSFFRNDLLGVLLLGKKTKGGWFKRDELDFFQALASDVAMAIYNAQLFEQLQDEAERRYKLFMGSILALAKEIDAKDHYTSGHTDRVIDYSLAIVRKLKELNTAGEITEEFIEDLKIASLLHDVGKIGIPEKILNKNGKLDDDEYNIIKQHTNIGIAILDPIKEFLRDALLGIKYHHERFDGTGYPEGLKGEKIPLMAAIIGVADSYDAMITDRPYRKALTKTNAIKEIEKYCGSQFHPLIVEAMIKLFEENKI
ncbi:MAG: HD-GYP domain-containing protein [Candidatus Gygaella obscura]|nr:HD-GYP domain-containing protein [Candidatus Gygaella obscura]